MAVPSSPVCVLCSLPCWVVAALAPRAGTGSEETLKRAWLVLCDSSSQSLMNKDVNIRVFSF